MDQQRYEEEVDEIETALDGMRLKDRKRLERKIRAGEVVYRQGKFVYAEDEDREAVDGSDDSEEDEDEDNGEIKEESKDGDN